MANIITRDKSYYRSLVTLAFPVAMQGLIAFLASFADNLMVSSLGDGAVSGVYFGSQMSVFVQMFTGGVSGVILILSVQYWGKKDTENVKNILSIGIRIGTIIGAVFTLAGLLFPEAILRAFTSDPESISQGVIYLRTVCCSYIFFCLTQSMLSAMRAVETPSIGMYISLISLIVDVSLNALFIYVLGWGVFGAAFSTVIGRVIETVVIALYILKMDKKLQMRIRDLVRFDRLLLGDFVRYGLPLVGGDVVWIVNTMGNSMIFGRFFDATVATGVSIANTMSTLAYITISGLASAVGVITGKTVGAGKYELMKEYARTTQVLFLCVGLFSGALVASLKLPFVGLYGGISEAAAQQAKLLITVLSVTIIGTGFQMPCLFGLVKSGGDISFVFKNDAAFVFLVVLPSALIAAMNGAPAWVVFACLKCDQILKCFVALVKIPRYNWMKDLTRDNATA